MRRQIYFKATLNDGESYRTPKIYYKMGINIHPDPEKDDKSACGVGIHLAKSVSKALQYVPKATEMYIAEAGVIRGEDDDKVRCDSCNIIRKMEWATVHRIVQTTRSEEAKRREVLEKEKDMIKMLGEHLFKTGGLPGKDWLDKNVNKVTQEMIDNCKLEVSVGKQHFSFNNNLSKKDMRYILSGAIK